MASTSHSSFSVTVTVIVELCFLLSLPKLVLSLCKNPPILFVFGDSNSDTGGLAAGLGYSINPPHGRDFNGGSSGRLSDGRLIIDFLCESLNTNLLRPYMESVGTTTFANGANFAVVGSATLPRYQPFALHVQVMQFLHFKSRNLELSTSGSGTTLINEEGFRNALYIFDIGQNDLSDSFALNISYAQIVRKIPLVLSEIKNSIKDLYKEGGRKFWVQNTGPLGCLPQKLTLVSDDYKAYDRYGCISACNDASKLYNEGLLHLCSELRNEMRDATIVYVDIFSVKYDLISNSAKYGFSSPLMACCGSGGPPYNYNIRVQCGQPGHQVCSEGSTFLNWDGIHYTEFANSIVASKLWSGNYTTPHTTFDFFCQ